jgi:hypothetical protein
MAYGHCGLFSLLDVQGCVRSSCRTIIIINGIPYSTVDSAQFLSYTPFYSTQSSYPISTSVL